MRPVSISEFFLRPRSAPIILKEEALRHAQSDDAQERPIFPEMAVTDGSEDALLAQPETQAAQTDPLRPLPVVGNEHYHWG